MKNFLFSLLLVCTSIAFAQKLTWSTATDSLYDGPLNYVFTNDIGRSVIVGNPDSLPVSPKDVFTISEIDTIIHKRTPVKGSPIVIGDVKPLAFIDDQILFYGEVFCVSHSGLKILITDAQSVFSYDLTHERWVTILNGRAVDTFTFAGVPEKCGNSYYFFHSTFRKDHTDSLFRGVIKLGGSNPGTYVDSIINIRFRDLQTGIVDAECLKDKLWILAKQERVGVRTQPGSYLVRVTDLKVDSIVKMDVEVHNSYFFGKRTSLHLYKESLLLWGLVDTIRNVYTGLFNPKSGYFPVYIDTTTISKEIFGRVYPVIYGDYIFTYNMFKGFFQPHELPFSYMSIVNPNDSGIDTVKRDGGYSLSFPFRNYNYLYSFSYGRNFDEVFLYHLEQDLTTSLSRNLSSQGSNCFVYPNPVTSSEISISITGITGCQGGNCSIALSDMQGRLVRSWKDLSSSREVRLDTPNIPAGIYNLFIRFACDSEVRQWNRKIILQ